MSPLAILFNLAWIVFGGLWMAVGWLIAAVIMAITIIGIPWARAAFNIAAYTLLPFGQRAVSRAEHYGQHDIGTGAARLHRQPDLADPGRLVARARPPRPRGPPGRDHHRHPVCLGAPQARRPRALADRQDDRADRGLARALRPEALTRGGRYRRPSFSNASATPGCSDWAAARSAVAPAMSPKRSRATPRL